MQIPYPKSDLIKGIRWLTEPILYPESHGDVWSCAWADDGEVYTVSDDTQGIAQSCNSNLAVHRVTGTPPDHKMVTVNPMADYGKMCGVDGFDTWKANGMTSIDGVLYLGVSQHSGAGDYPDNIQRVYDASIVKSLDHGKTWSVKPPVGQAMFPGPRFGTPFFVQFGQDYQDVPGEYGDYVYLVSSSATWNNGNYMSMARVRRDRIGRLDRADYEFIVDIDAANDPTWSNQYRRRPAAIFFHRGYTSMTGIQYVPAVERFIMGQWAYIAPDGPQPWRWTYLALYEAPRPWGPWRYFHVEPDWGYAYYNPSLPAKWFEDGGRRMWMTTAGNFSREPNTPFSYGFIVQKLELVFNGGSQTSEV